MSSDTDELLADLAALPVQPGAALRLMRMLDDHRVSAETLGMVIQRDPALSSQVIRLANTSYYGLREPVASAWRAVTVVGLSTVRSIVTTTAFDLFDPDAVLPDRYWEHSLATAAAASVVAKRVGIQPSDAFSAGLLQDLGRALIARRAEAAHDRITARMATDDLSAFAAEAIELGVTHSEITAQALEALRFPPEVVDAARRHHDDPETIESVVAKVLFAADLLAKAVDRFDPDLGETGPLDPRISEPLDCALELLTIGADRRTELTREAFVEYDAVNGFLSLTA